MSVIAWYVPSGPTTVMGIGAALVCGRDVKNKTVDMSSIDTSRAQIILLLFCGCGCMVFLLFGLISRYVHKNIS